MRQRNPGTRDPKRRFTAQHTQKPPEQVVALPADHEAIINSTTRFPTRIFTAAKAPRLLISGEHQRKIGSHITKGPWKNLPVFTLTLEERKTCPSNCSNWNTCYGNNMPHSKRIKHGADLIVGLRDEIFQKAKEYPKGFVVRLHVLGDFYSEHYVQFWQHMMTVVPRMHLFGYTAHHSQSPIGSEIDYMNFAYHKRCLIRFSAGLKHDPLARAAATTVWTSKTRKELLAEGRVLCPVQDNTTACCGTCALCWNPAVKDIAFLGHGHAKPGPKKKTSHPPADMPPLAGDTTQADYTPTKEIEHA